MILLSNVRSEGSDLAHLAAELDIPTIAGLQHQGDVSVIPAAMASPDYQPAVTQVPASGIAVVHGEAGGHTHLLLASGDVRYEAAHGAADDITLGSLEVGDGATAWLDHPEHGNTGIAPGRYVLRRKREMAPRVLDPEARRKREQARKQARKQAARDQAIREQAAREQEWNASVRFVAD
ncbi:hypothetical protein D0T12_00270 [Actinomadura spongiicola]|uniref:Uncharacterized protein n=1 Tax=Actinomadura spongiicola TaxID=2303421 RepID=A0A372GN02_9ACTN|nr:hypothetical protein [Actinomadura spongiicola]RFS86770.1 hypothetical protein D0T12_00270 [Actinomadura spongiicola]